MNKKNILSTKYGANKSIHNTFKLQFISVAIGILIGVIVTVGTMKLANYIFTNKTANSTTKIKKTINRSNISNNLSKNNHKDQNLSENYDFYKLLSKQESIKPAPKAKLTASNTKLSSSVVTTKYFIEVAKYHDLTIADALKAKLILQGFEARINQNILSESNKIYYLVIIGPLSSKEIALQKQHELTLAGFNNTVIKN